MKKMWRVLLGGALCLCSLFIFGGCQAVPVSNVNSTANATPAPTASATPVVVSGNTTGANNMPVTLPVLDAMFAEEKFAADLKSQLQLTDEQIERLRKVAREETGSLRESETGEHEGTTSAATARAAAEIKSVLGDERAARFNEFVSSRWAGGGENGATETGGGAAGGKPNSVPADTRIVVNAPAYRMDVFENGQLVKSYKVGIGYPEFPLPVGMRKANTIIFNPTWTPPDEPWVESPSSKVKVGERVAAGSPLNPLGPIKIPIGLPSLIHGGKAQAKLGGFASHGCVGLTNAQVKDVARVLGGLGGAQLTEADMAAYEKNRTETKEVKLERPVAVELRYETIVVEDGKLHIYRDVYDRDTNTEENLRAVLTAAGVSLDSLSEAERAKVLAALKQMARDATGKPADGEPNASPTATPAAAEAANKNAKVKTDAESGKVTRTIKGQKEIVIELAALKGKGYPAPVALDAGSGATKAAGGQKGKRG